MAGFFHEEEGNDDAGDFHDGNQGGAKEGVFDFERIKEGEAGDECDGGNASVVGGKGGGVGVVEFADRATGGEDDDGDEGSEEDGSDEGEGDLGKGDIAESDAAFQSDGEEEVDAEGGVGSVWEFEIAMKELGDGSEDEAEDHRADEVESDEFEGVHLGLLGGRDAERGRLDFLWVEL